MFRSHPVFYGLFFLKENSLDYVANDEIIKFSRATTEMDKSALA